MKFYWKPIVLTVVLVLVLAACAPGAANEPTATAPAGAPTTAAGESEGYPAPAASPTAPDGYPAPEMTTQPPAVDGYPAPQNLGDLAGTSWVLESFGEPGSENAVIGEQEVTLTFGSEGTASGNANCNSYSGSYSVADGTVTFTPFVSTLMACADENATTQESTYLAALQAGGAYTMSGDTLVITTPDGLVLNYTRGAQ